MCSGSVASLNPLWATHTQEGKGDEAQKSGGGGLLPEQRGAEQTAHVTSESQRGWIPGLGMCTWCQVSKVKELGASGGGTVCNAKLATPLPMCTVIARQEHAATRLGLFGHCSLSAAPAGTCHHRGGPLMARLAARRRSLRSAG